MYLIIIQEIFDSISCWQIRFFDVASGESSLSDKQQSCARASHTHRVTEIHIILPSLAHPLRATPATIPPPASTTKHQKALRSHVPTSIFWFPIQFQNHTDAQDTFFIFPYRRTWTVFFCSALVLLMLLDGTHQHQAISLSLRCGGLGLCPISHFHAHFAWAANLPAATGSMLIFFLSLSSCSWLMMIWLLNASVDTQNRNHTSSAHRFACDKWQNDVVRPVPNRDIRTMQRRDVNRHTEKIKSLLITWVTAAFFLLVFALRFCFAFCNISSYSNYGPIINQKRVNAHTTHELDKHKCAQHSTFGR